MQRKRSGIPAEISLLFLCEPLLLRFRVKMPFFQPASQKGKFP